MKISGGGRGYSGNFTVTVVPLPSSLSNVISALWMITACLTMDRPSPVLPTALEWLLSTL